MRREAIPPLLLVVVAILFAGLVHNYRLTTWTGPGFSMFASSDHIGTRRVQISVTAGQNTAPAEVPDDLAAELESQRHTPDQERLTATAERLLTLRWSLNDDGVFEADKGRQAEQVTLRLVTIAADGDHVVVTPILETVAS